MSNILPLSGMHYSPHHNQTSDALPLDALSGSKDMEFMSEAQRQAGLGAALGEIPVGAVVVLDNEIVASAHNRKEIDQDPTAHAEVLVIQSAAKKLGRWRLSGCTLYVTLEPCPMCAGAIVHSRVDRVVYAARDPRTGAVESIYQILNDKRLNHTPEVTQGVGEAEASQALKDFFKALREKRSAE